MELNFVNLFIAFSAVWRISSLVANEPGPWHMFKRFRQFCARLCNKYKFCRDFHLYELVNCEWCNSIWFGIFITFIWFMIGRAFILLLLPLALSTWAIIIKHTVQALKKLEKEGGE